MPTIFSHAIIAASGASLLSVDRADRLRLLALGTFCSLIPDADVVSFALGIPYHHPLGHRGLTHSPFFAMVLALLLMGIFYRRLRLGSGAWWRRFGFLALLGISHGVADAMTNGGLGIAFLAPFDNGRYFLPWRPIEVSPIGLEGFLSAHGWSSVKSELLWIGLPCACISFLAFLKHRRS